MLGTESGDTTLKVPNSSIIARVKLEESITESVVPQKIRCPCLLQSQISPVIEWQCPICMKNYSWKDVIIDPYFNQILRTIELSGGADITEVEIKTNGVWRVKNMPTIPNLEKWHWPDGFIMCSSDIGTASSSANASSTTFIGPAEVFVFSGSEEDDDDYVVCTGSAQRNP